MAARIVSSGKGNCLLIVVQFRQPTGHNIACIRFGYSEKKKSSATDGGENLSSIPDSDGIGFKAKFPVTVYLEGVLTRPELSVILHASWGKGAQTKPKKKQFEYPINPGSRLVIINYVAASGVFVLAIENPYIQKICAPYTVPFSPPGIIGLSLWKG